jgi:hypothetical protein
MKETTKISGAIIIAAGLIALSLHLRPTPGRYAFEASDGTIVRYDTLTGEALICGRVRCLEVSRTGKRTKVETLDEIMTEIENIGAR